MDVVLTEILLFQIGEIAVGNNCSIEWASLSNAGATKRYCAATKASVGEMKYVLTTQYRHITKVASKRSASKLESHFLSIYNSMAIDFLTTHSLSSSVSGLQENLNLNKHKTQGCLHYTYMKLFCPKLHKYHRLFVQKKCICLCMTWKSWCLQKKMSFKI